MTEGLLAESGMRATDAVHPTRRWAAVIVNYEAGPLLIDCVRSVLADTSAGPVELVVVDNGSRDGSVEALQTAFPEVRVVRSPGNVGYARGANFGIAASYAPVIAVLNADLTLVPGSAGALVARLEQDAGLGAVGAYRALSSYTQLGGQLTVFGLPE